MKILLVLRHAKSSWNDTALDDHERPLNQRGRWDGPRMGELVREYRLTPDMIISSDAVRARRTAEAVAEAARYAGEIVLDPLLYLASPPGILAVLRTVPETNAGTVMRRFGMGRRGFLGAAGSLAAVSVLGGAKSPAAAQTTGAGSNPAARVSGRRKLGSLEVSSVGISVQNMSRTYQTTVPHRAEMINIIRTAFDRGVTFYDAAEAYGPHEVERILGEGVAPFRDKVVITSKFGWNIDQETGERRPGLNSRPSHIKVVVEGMLKRLRTERIDLLYQHRVDPQVPIEDVAGAIKDLKSEGKVRHWGLSEMGLSTLRRAHAELPVTAVQNEYSMLWRGPEKEVIPTCEELGIGFVPWSPLGVRFLTGAIDANTRFAPGDIRGVEPRFSPENLPHNLALVNLVKKWAERKNATLAQIALAWLMAQKSWIVPIPGTTQMAHMFENIGASAVRLTPSEVAELNAAVSAIEIRGARLPEQVLVFSGVEAPPKK